MNTGNLSILGKHVEAWNALPAAVSGTITIDWSLGDRWYGTLASGATTLAYTNVPTAGSSQILLLRLQQPASGAAGTITWPSGSTYPGGSAPTLSTANNAVDIVSVVVNPAATGYQTNLSYSDTAFSGGSSVSTGTYASRPTAGTAGRLYLPTDGVAVYEDTGSVWSAFGPISPLTEPPSTGWSWINQGTSTVTFHGSVPFLLAPTTTLGNNLRCYVRSVISSSNYTLTVAIQPFITATNFSRAGICVTDGTKLITLGYVFNTSFALSTDSFTNTTTFNTNYQVCTGNSYIYNKSILWLRIKDDGTNLIFSVSPNSYDWIQLYSAARTIYLTATQYGFYAHSDQGNVYQNGIQIPSWLETTP